MKLELNVLSSVGIKRKKPWPKLVWLGEEQEDVYLLDDRRISQLYIPSGKTKKKIARLHSLMDDVCAVNVTQNGRYLCGALCNGKVFLWQKDKDSVHFITGLPKLFNDADKGNPKNKIFMSSCGKMMLLMVGLKKLFLWQRNEEPVSVDTQDITGTWCQVHHGDYVLPDQSNKETSIDGVFYSDHIVGNCGTLSYVFNKGTNLTITTLNVKCDGQESRSSLAHSLANQEDETVPREVTENSKFSIKWRSLTRPLYGLTPATRLVKGRFVYVCRYSPDGQLLAVVLNQKRAKNTRLVFCSPLHGTMTVADLECCGGSEESSGRIWWVSDIAWTVDSLLLIGITRNGALFITSKLGEPINLVTSGCVMEMGPSLFLPLHPRITIRSFQENIPPDNSEISSGSEKDVFHQKFSVAIHPRYPIFLCSDGYMVTILQFNDKPGYAEMMTNLIEVVSSLLPKGDQSFKVVSDDVKKSPQEMPTAAGFLSRVATPSENSSPGSTLSGFGMVKNMEAGIVSFGDVASKTRSYVQTQQMSEQEKCFRAKKLLLQAFGIGTCCGSYWSNDMAIAMNLIIHMWVKLFSCLLEDESNSTTLSEKTVPFGNIITFIRSVLEIFRWDMQYQHCLPWLSQFASSTVKTLVASRKFGSTEIINVCVRLLQMAEISLNQIYSWCAVSNRSTVHLLGDSFTPTCDAVCLPTIRSTDISENQRVSYSSTNDKLDYKLERSWLVLHSYICKVYEMSTSPDHQLVQSLCFIQRKLQKMNSPRNLVSISKMDDPFDEGQTFYLEGNHAHAITVLKQMFYNSSKTVTDQPRESFLRPSEPDVPLFQQDLSSQMTRDADTLLTILHINLENYNLKAALTLVYSFINTNRPFSMQDRLNDETRSEDSAILFPPFDTERGIASSSSLIQLQLSLLTRYPLAWITDNCALSVVQELARFMCCYFTNLPLTIPVPFQPYSRSTFSSEGVANEEFFGSRPSAANVKKLLQQKVTDAVAEQKLELYWTADHAMELLIVSGLLGEAAWFSNHLGDWKIAFMLSVIQELHRRSELDFYQLPEANVYFPPPIEAVQPKQLMLTKIRVILHLQDDSVSECQRDGESFSPENIVPSLKNAFGASVIAGLDLVPDIVEYLMEKLREKVSKLDWMVAHDLYLPAPPLYCPQPTRNEEEILGDVMRNETIARNEIAEVVQKILAVYRASNCFLLCTHEYCKHVATHFTDEENNALPSVIKEFLVSESLHFDTSVDNCEVADPTNDFFQENHVSTVRILQSFQEFCGLMWLLHTRDQVALTSRAYTKVKQSLFLDEDSRKVVIQKCEEALTSLKKILPFSDFLNATHDVFDGMITLLSELPLTTETVDILAEYFHTTPPSLDLSTVEKVKRLTRRLRNVSGPMGMGNGEPLSTIFQKKCEERRKGGEDVSINHIENCPFHLESAFAHCNTLGYEKDSAYLRFLDTFLLIAVSKNITKSDHVEIPLILSCARRFERVEISGNEQVNENAVKPPKRSSDTSPGIQRSQSFHDMRSKTRATPLSPNSPNQNEHGLLRRSNSLTDVRRNQKSKLSKELQAVLPRLIWLKKWCSMGDEQGGDQGGSKSFSLLSVITSQAAIRVRVSLPMIVNTLWLMENYYKEFVVAKGRCVKNKNVSGKRRKKTKANGGNSRKSQKNEEKKRGGVENQVGGEGTREREPGKWKNKRRGLEGKILEGRGQKEEQEEPGPEGPQSKEYSRGEVESARRPRESRSKGLRTGKRGCKQPGTEGQNEVEAQVVGKIPSTNVSLDVREARIVDDVEEKQIVSDLSSKKQPKPRRTSRMVPHRTSKENVSRIEFMANLEKPFILIEDFDSAGSLTDVPSAQKKLFPSSPSSSVDGKSKGSKHVKDELPLLSLPLLHNSHQVSDDKDSSKHSSGLVSWNSQELFPTSDPNGSRENGDFAIREMRLTEENDSLSSEALSVGQIRSDFVVVTKQASETSTSVESKQGDSGKNVRGKKPIGTKISAESSGYERSDNPRIKRENEASLLRRIIRSEMRKFVKSQQAQFKSQSSPVETTEDEIFRNNFPKDEDPSISRKTKSDKATRQKPARNRLQKSNRSRDKNRIVSPPKEPSSSLNEPSSLTEDHNGTADHHRTGSYSKTKTGTSNHPSSIPPQSTVSEHQLPAISMNGWPFWFQAPFSVAPPWLWPNSATKVSDDKGIQVSTEGSVVFEERDIEPSEERRNEGRKKIDKESMTMAVELQSEVMQHGIVELKECHVGDMSHVAVQTDNRRFSNSQVNTTKERHGEQTLQLLSLEQDHQVQDKETREEGDPYQDVFQEQLSRNNERETKRFPLDVSHVVIFDRDVQENANRGATLEEQFSIPLLKIPPELSNTCSASPMLPFKIAWPDMPLESGSIPEPSDMPLLQLDDLKQRSEAEGFMAFSAPVTNPGNNEYFPLLHLADSRQEDSSLSNFRFLEVPTNQNLEFPLLHLPEAEEQRFIFPANLLLENSSQATGGRKSRSVAKTPRENIPSNRNNSIEITDKTSIARLKRRERLQDSTSRKLKQQSSMSVPKHVSNDSRSSDVETRNSVITVRPRSISKTDTKNKPPKRREKLRELNNIIRELERGISDEDDLVLSDVSELLSEEIKYENFEKQTKRTDVKKYVSADKEAPGTSNKSNDERVNRVDWKPSKISNLHKSSTISAHDIHAEFPSNVPVEALSCDAKVGTTKIVHLPASVQTDASVRPSDISSNLPKRYLPVSVQTDVAGPSDDFDDLSKISPSLRTKELSVQTEAEKVIKDTSRPAVCDAGINTENVSSNKEDSSVNAVYPRLPPQIYLNLDFNQDGVEQVLPLAPEDENVEEIFSGGSQKMFISVADIGQDAVRRQIQEQTVSSISDDIKKKYPLKMEEEKFEGGELQTASPDASVQTGSYLSRDDYTIHQGDPTTVHMFSSSDVKPSSVPLRASTAKQAQQIAKETVSQKFHEMNEQFEVIDRIASNMDRELQHSNMLLRTIDNLNKMTDHVTSPERQTHDVVVRDEQRKGERRRTRYTTIHHDASTEEKKRVWQGPPWTNKTIGELTEITDKGETEAKIVETVVAEGSDGGNAREDSEDTEAFKVVEKEVEDKVGSKTSSRRTSVSSNLSKRRPSQDSQLASHPATSRHNTTSPRSLASLVPHDAANLSKEKLKEPLRTSTTSTIVDARLRNKTPQKQQELQEWMSKKRKLRHKEWTATVKEQREAEHKPFRSKGGKTPMSSRKLKKIENERQDGRRAQKKENVDQRLVSAYDLINEMIAEPMPKEPTVTYNPTRSTRRKNTKKVGRVKANNRYNGTQNATGKQARTKKITKSTNEKLHQPDLIQAAPLYDYDVEESGRRFITRKSYEKYQTKMSGSLSFDLDRNSSFGKNGVFKSSYDLQVDDLLDDVSLSETLDGARLDNLDSLLSGDSELRELLSDVIVEGKTRRTMITTNEDIITVNSGLYSNNVTAKNDDRWQTRKGPDAKRMMFGTFNVGPERSLGEERPYLSDKLLSGSQYETVNNWDVADDLEMSDEVAALLAEAKAAVGDDFSGGSEVGDIDWNEVDNVLQEK